MNVDWYQFHQRDFLDPNLFYGGYHVTLGQCQKLAKGCYKLRRKEGGQ